MREMSVLLASCLAVAIPSGVEAAERIVSKDGKYFSAADGMEMVRVPAGEFVMGSDAGNYNEKPAHKVFLDDYLIDIHEVTNFQFEQFVQATGYFPQGPWRRGYAPGEETHPVRFVTWHDARAYAKWAGKRLPTEAEWEKAARGAKGLVYPWGNDWKPPLRGGDAADEPGPVGSSPGRASPYGVLDMGGSVWEWVQDWYDRYYYRSFKGGETANNPAGPEDGAEPERRFQESGTAGGNERSTLKVIRGGEGKGRFKKENSRTSKRMWGNPRYWLNDTGFRCAAD
ncbi:MAG: formylglycine-generating enzyme family protein [Elusimicrobiota bacterium]